MAQDNSIDQMIKDITENNKNNKDKDLNIINQDKNLEQ